MLVCICVRVCLPACVCACIRVCVHQGVVQPVVDSDIEDASEMEEERERPEIGSESESSTFGPTKKKKKKPKEKKEKKPRKKKRDEEDDDDDDDDGNMKVSWSREKLFCEGLIAQYSLWHACQCRTPKIGNSQVCIVDVALQNVCFSENENNSKLKCR